MAEPTPVKTQDEIAAEQADKQAKEAQDKFQKKLDGIKDEDERKIVKLHNEGVQTYEIAKQVYKFVNNDTVGQVILVVRKHYADDFSDVEDVNSTKGYSGI